MKKNLFLLFAYLVSVCYSFSASGELSSENSSSKPKNVLFIIVDDLNTSLGTYGHPTVLTPNIDKLANQGIQFNNAYCNYAVCNPSRSSFLTGVRPETIGIIDNKTRLQSKLGDKITLPNLFKKNGYYTVSLGKVFHGRDQHNDPKAWDEIYTYGTTELGKRGEERNMTGGALKWCRWRAAEGGDADQQDGQVAEKAIEIIKSDNNKPFFLAVGFHKPHDPFVAPKKYFDLYPLVVCDPPLLPEGWAAPYSHSLPNQTDIFNQFTDQDKREFLRSYYACTSFMDAQVGKVLNALKEENLMDNTIIFFLGDHGYHLGEHEWWNKVTIYEKGHRAPLIIVNGDKHVSGLETNAMIEFVDFYPTLADICQLKNVPDYLEGESFRKVLENPLTSFRDVVYAIIRRGEMMGKTVKTKDWRYIEWGDGKKGTELYNEHADPLEYNNLSGNKKYDNVQGMMKKLLDQYRVDI